MKKLTPVIIILVAATLLCQGSWLFRDAQKRGRFPWFWGIWGLIHFPDPIIFYYFFVIRKDRKKSIKDKK